MNITFRNRTWDVGDNPDHAPFWSWVQAGTWETHTFNVLDRYLRSGDTFLDLGAWIGPISMYAYSMCSRVISLEPDPVAFTELEANLDRNQMKRVERFRSAVNHYDGVIHLGSNYLGASTTREYNLDPLEHWIEAPCEKLTTLLGRLDIQTPLFIKTDIEGCETNLFAGTARDFIMANRPTILMSHHPFWWKGDQDEHWRRFCSLADGYRYKFNSTNLTPFDPHSPCWDVLLTNNDPR